MNASLTHVGHTDYSNNERFIVRLRLGPKSQAGQNGVDTQCIVRSLFALSIDGRVNEAR